MVQEAHLGILLAFGVCHLPFAVAYRLTVRVYISVRSSKYQFALPALHLHPICEPFPHIRSWTRTRLSQTHFSVSITNLAQLATRLSKRRRKTSR